MCTTNISNLHTAHPFNIAAPQQCKNTLTQPHVHQLREHDVCFHRQVNALLFVKFVATVHEETQGKGRAQGQR
jgi:hypothetical protein